MVSSMSRKAIIFSGENDEEAFCDKCVKDFDEVGGCECIDNDDCDQLSLIPEGCFICGQKAMKYCESKIGRNLQMILNKQINLTHSFVIFITIKTIIILSFT